MRAINDDLLHQWIVACIEDGRYHFTTHALTEHALVERFTASQALDALRNGTIIERRDGDGRCVVCGECRSVGLDPAYIAKYIHCVVRWDDVQQVVVITMYRPKSSDWKNQYTRR